MKNSAVAKMTQNKISNEPEDRQDAPEASNSSDLKKRCMKATGKTLRWMARPGYSKHASFKIMMTGQSYLPPAMQVEQLQKTIREMTLSEWETKKAREKAISECDGLDDKSAFEKYVVLFEHTEETLQTAKITYSLRRWFYYLFGLMCIWLLWSSTSADFPVWLVIIGKTMLAAIALSFLIMGLHESWRATQIEDRSMFSFIGMFERPWKFFI